MQRRFTIELTEREAEAVAYIAKRLDRTAESVMRHLYQSPLFKIVCVYLDLEIQSLDMVTGEWGTDWEEVTRRLNVSVDKLMGPPDGQLPN